MNSFKPLTEEAKDGRVLIIRRGCEMAVAYWTGGEDGMWAYGPKEDNAVSQVDFEPTEWAELSK